MSCVAYLVPPQVLVVLLVLEGYIFDFKVMLGSK